MSMVLTPKQQKALEAEQYRGQTRNKKPVLFDPNEGDYWTITVHKNDGRTFLIREIDDDKSTDICDYLESIKRITPTRGGGMRVSRE